jgi:hypothetical protein
MHNMQKHLMTFIQSLISIKSRPESELSQVELCAK